MPPKVFSRLAVPKKVPSLARKTKAVKERNKKKEKKKLKKQKMKINQQFYISVQPDVPFSIHVSSSSGTGYSWKIALPKSITLLSTRNVEQSSTLAGAPTVTEFVLTTNSLGVQWIFLTFSREWEEDQGAPEVVAVKVLGRADPHI